MKQTKEKAPSLKRMRLVGKARSRGDMAYESLKRAIIRGDIAPRQRLIETELSVHLNMSRVPVREAIKKLEQDALIKKRKNGFVVRDLSREDIEETYGLRALLEGYAAYLATERMTNELFKNLQDSMEAYREALDAGDTKKLVQLNTQFHKIIYRTARSQRLYALIKNFRDSIHRYRTPFMSSPEYSRISLSDHEAMLAAMREKDMKKAEQLLKRHVLGEKEIILKELESGKYKRR